MGLCALPGQPIRSGIFLSPQHHASHVRCELSRLDLFSSPTRRWSSCATFARPAPPGRAFSSPREPGNNGATEIHPLSPRSRSIKNGRNGFPRADAFRLRADLFRRWRFPERTRPDRHPDTPDLRQREVVTRRCAADRRGSACGPVAPGVSRCWPPRGAPRHPSRPPSSRTGRSSCSGRRTPADDRQRQRRHIDPRSPLPTTVQAGGGAFALTIGHFLAKSAFSGGEVDLSVRRLHNEIEETVRGRA